MLPAASKWHEALPMRSGALEEGQRKRHRQDIHWDQCAVTRRTHRYSLASVPHTQPLPPTPPSPTSSVLAWMALSLGGGAGPEPRGLFAYVGVLRLDRSRRDPLADIGIDEEGEADRGCGATSREMGRKRSAPYKIDRPTSSPISDRLKGLDSPRPLKTYLLRALFRPTDPPTSISPMRRRREVPRFRCDIASDRSPYASVTTLYCPYQNHQTRAESVVRWSFL